MDRYEVYNEWKMLARRIEDLADDIVDYNGALEIANELNDLESEMIRLSLITITMLDRDE